MADSAASGETIEHVGELFASGDERFLDALATVHHLRELARFAERWAIDSRPWARSEVVRYLSWPLANRGHEPVVKRLFKAAETRQDDALMAAFVVAFDRLVRRRRRQVDYWDRRSRQSLTGERLVTPRNTIPLAAPQFSPSEGQTKRSEQRLFSYRTRYYLRRRAWRYFRRLRYSRPVEYPAAVANALMRYTDDDVARGEDLLECWGLLHCCFGNHDALEFGPTRIHLREGCAISELQPAPKYPELWRTRESVSVLVAVVSGARSRLVRVWAMELIVGDHPAHFDSVTHAQLQSLLSHEDEDVQRLGITVLQGCGHLDSITVRQWLELIEACHGNVLLILCEIVRSQVSASRVELPECLALATAPPSPVAELGFELLQQKAADVKDPAAWLPLADATCPIWGERMAGWALDQAATRDTVDIEYATPFFDSRLPACRRGAFAWLTRNRIKQAEHTLWLRLIESPYPDVRERLVAELQRREKMPRLSAQDLAPLWASILLGVHRGGRQKLKATTQLADAILREPDQAAALVPLLAMAVRSIRGPEMRAGLAAVAHVVTRRPELAELFSGLLPELELDVEAR